MIVNCWFQYNVVNQSYDMLDAGGDKLLRQSHESLRPAHWYLERFIVTWYLYFTGWQFGADIECNSPTATFKSISSKENISFNVH